MDTPEWVNLEEVEALAKARMTKMAFDYYASGSETQTALRDNRSAFGRYRILPRILRDVSAVDTGTELLGRRISMPVIIAPMAMHGLAHPDKEPATARAAAARGVPMCVSTMANVGLDDVIAESRHPFALFQLYVIRDRDIVEGWVRAAEAAGYKALVVTVDAPRLGRREADERNRFELPAGLQLANLAPLVEKYSSKLQQHREGADKGAPAPAGVLRAKATPEGSGLFHLFANVVDDSLTWDILPWLQTATKLPVFIKGVLAPQDAVLAVDYGADGIIVSNHGGRQLDYAPTALDMLPDIVAAVRARERGAGKGKIPILMDGGVRRGTDILKALALGADAVLVGRPVLYGLAAGGQSGVDRVLGLLGEELRLAMALAGVTRVTQLGPRALLQVAAGPVAVPPPSSGWAGDEDDGPQEAQ